MPKSGQKWDPAFATRSPLFAPFREIIAPLEALDCWPTPDVYTELVERRRARDAPEQRSLSFVAARPKPRRFRRRELRIEELYDGSIAELGQVPCVTESYHDLWNAIAFAAFPRAKRALHARQYRALGKWVDLTGSKLPSRRTREQDALTVFDEGGTVLVAAEEFTSRWRQANHALELTQNERLILFGHALMEHAQYGNLELRSCAVVLERSGSSRPLLDWVDRELTGRLDDPKRFSAPGADGVVRIDATGRLWLEAASGPQPGKSALASAPSAIIRP